MTEVVPAIIPNSFDQLASEAAKVADHVSLVQVDICDGVFVPNKTWPYSGDKGEFAQLVVEEIGLPFWDDLDYEFHLMIEHPERSVEEWITVGASSIVVQIETVDTAVMNSIIDMCKSGDVQIGIALKASTPIETLEPFASRLDFVQCMGSDDLGHHGAEFSEHVYGKIAALRSLYPQLAIAIDIGVNEETASRLIDAGATKLVAGAAIFDAPSISEALAYFQNL